MRQFIVMYYTGISSKPYQAYDTLKEAETAAEHFRRTLYQGGIEDFDVWVEMAS